MALARVITSLTEVDHSVLDTGDVPIVSGFELMVMPDATFDSSWSLTKDD